MGGDKIVLLDGAGANGGGAATNGLLSMIPGMFANLIGGNKMDPNLVAALMNGRNNQDGFGGANGWWLWIIVLFWLWGGRGFGNGFGNGGDCCANGLPAQLNNDYGRELLMQAIQGNRSAIDQIASALNCSTTQLQNAICNVQGAIDKVAGQVGVSEPRYLPPQPGQYQAMQTRVVDLTVELTGETKTYTVPESQNVAKAMGITLSTSIDPIMNELNAIKNTSQDIINSVDAHRAKIEACESILEDINPAFKQTREQDRKIAGIENKVNDLTDSFEDLKKLIVERLK